MFKYPIACQNRDKAFELLRSLAACGLAHNGFFTEAADEWVSIARAPQSAEIAPSASGNSAMDAIAALADKWCDATNQPTSICVALYEFTKWARQQHQ